jgi:hypothetical protein
MRTVLGSFLLSVCCSLATLTQALLAIGGVLGFFIGLLPIISWVLIFPFYLLDEK